MSKPTKEENERLEWLDAFYWAYDAHVYPIDKKGAKKVYDAIRALILAVGEWRVEIIAILANMALGNKKTQRKELANAIMLLQKIRDFGEEGK